MKAKKYVNKTLNIIAGEIKRGFDSTIESELNSGHRLVFTINSKKNKINIAVIQPGGEYEGDFGSVNLTGNANDDAGRAFVAGLRKIRYDSIAVQMKESIIAFIGEAEKKHCFLSVFEDNICLSKIEDGYIEISIPVKVPTAKDRSFDAAVFDSVPVEKDKEKTAGFIIKKISNKLFTEEKE